jgi:hypothetical protein
MKPYIIIVRVIKTNFIVRTIGIRKYDKKENLVLALIISFILSRLNCSEKLLKYKLSVNRYSFVRKVTNP